MILKPMLVIIPGAFVLAACGSSGGAPRATDTLTPATGVAFADADTAQRANGGDEQGLGDETPQMTLIDQAQIGTSLQYRRCSVDGKAVHVTRRWLADVDAESMLKDDEIGNVRSETWRAGASFGTNSSNHPNIGFSSADGSVMNGAPASHQPTAIACSDQAWAALGWQFSNNVAGLGLDTTLRSKTVRRNDDTGRITWTLVRGTRSAVYLDPSTTALHAGKASVAYFDQTFAAGKGRSVVTRAVRYGSDDQADSIRIATRAPHDDTREQAYALRTDADAPLIETVYRDLSSGWPQTERHLESGRFIAQFRDGTETRTTVADVVYRDNSCRCFT
jgi:hypothetical protein